MLCLLHSIYFFFVLLFFGEWKLCTSRLQPLFASQNVNTWCANYYVGDLFCDCKSYLVVSSHVVSLCPYTAWFRCVSHLDRFSRFFLQSLWQRIVILYNGLPLSTYNCIFPRGIWTSSNAWFTGPTRILYPNGISIGWAVFAGLTTVTDRPTDSSRDNASRSVTIGRIYVCIVLW